MTQQEFSNPKQEHGGPLAGKLVVDLSRALAGPHAGMMLGDLGARVIKVENPDGGDDTRGGLCQRLAEAASRQLPAQLPAQLT